MADICKDCGRVVGPSRRQCTASLAGARNRDFDNCAALTIERLRAQLKAATELNARLRLCVEITDKFRATDAAVGDMLHDWTAYDQARAEVDKT